MADIAVRKLKSGCKEGSEGDSGSCRWFPIEIDYKLGVDNSCKVLESLWSVVYCSYFNNVLVISLGIAEEKTSTSVMCSLLKFSVNDGVSFS